MTFSAPKVGHILMTSISRLFHVFLTWWFLWRRYYGFALGTLEVIFGLSLCRRNFSLIVFCFFCWLVFCCKESLILYYHISQFFRVQSLLNAEVLGIDVFAEYSKRIYSVYILCTNVGNRIEWKNTAKRWNSASKDFLASLLVVVWLFLQHAVC